MSVTHTARFVAGAADVRRIPPAKTPEIAFAGRSNVGKSSLLNRLVGSSKLARVSKTPGRTQQINFFEVDGKLGFVDLPGYGFARVPLSVKERWKVLVETYLTGRAALRLVIVLVDLRRMLQDDDVQLLEYLAAHGLCALVVGTKADKLPRGQRLQRARELQLLAARFGAEAMTCSSVTGEGITDLWRRIVTVAS